MTITLIYTNFNILKTASNAKILHCLNIILKYRVKFSTFYMKTTLEMNH